jgi:hypothetical protein
MVCFDIVLAFPLGTKQQTLGNVMRMDHIQENYVADVVGCFELNGYLVFRLAACDKDAVGILRDLPCPFFCLQVKLLRTDRILYRNFKATGDSKRPPRDSTILKDVYWSATNLEKCHTPNSILIASTDLACEF